jgi:hypothetical protein
MGRACQRRCTLSPTEIAHSVRATSFRPSAPAEAPLTPDQREQVKEATGKEAEALELTVEELEERITPMQLHGGS